MENYLSYCEIKKDVYCQRLSFCQISILPKLEWYICWCQLYGFNLLNSIHFTTFFIKNISTAPNVLGMTPKLVLFAWQCLFGKHNFIPFWTFYKDIVNLIRKNSYKNKCIKRLVCLLIVFLVGDYGKVTLLPWSRILVLQFWGENGWRLGK